MREGYEIHDKKNGMNVIDGWIMLLRLSLVPPPVQFALDVVALKRYEVGSRRGRCARWYTVQSVQAGELDASESNALRNSKLVKCTLGAC